MTEDDIPTGLATCMKSGNALQVVIPKAIIDKLNLQPRDRVIISIRRSNLPPKEARRTDLKKNLNIFKKEEIPKKEESQNEDMPEVRIDTENPQTS